MNSNDTRTAAERERDNVKTGLARPRPQATGKTDSDDSYGPFGRGDREPQKDSKAPRKGRR